MRYATVEDVEAGFRPLEDSEKTLCDALLDEAGIVIDAYKKDADEDASAWSPAGWCAASWMPGRGPLRTP
mgnify:CR=1 FL=1